MEITINGDPKEIADLVTQLQDRKIDESHKQATKTIELLVDQAEKGNAESFDLLKNLFESQDYKI